MVEMRNAPKILVIEDGAVMRIMAMYETSKFAKYVSIPEHASAIRKVDVSQLSLVFLDRHLSDEWQTAVDVFLKRLPDSVEIVEWTADSCGEPNTKASEIIPKGVDGMKNRVEQWAKQYGLPAFSFWSWNKLFG